MSMDNRYSSPESQAWLRLWVSIYGPNSLLAQYLKPYEPIPIIEPKVDPPHEEEPTVSPRRRLYSTLRKPRAKSAERRIARDIERVKKLPSSDWAKRIIDDARVNSITLNDLINGIEDYFEIFDGMRKVAPDAYNYFSRVGPPILTRNTLMLASQVDAPKTIANPHTLPSHFGIFLSNTIEERRDEVINDKPTLLDFHLFEKPKHHNTIAPPGTVIFRYSLISLKPKGFTKEEQKKYPSVRDNWGIWWYVGILPNGEIRALPHHMHHAQLLPNGYAVHHSRFTIPPGLYEVSKKNENGVGDPHRHVTLAFNSSVAMTAAGLAGIQVTIKKDKKSARFGLPIGSLKNFFSDRDVSPGSNRRKPIFHFRPAHDRHMKDGRIIPVGEYLAGERSFTWRDYEIIVGVPGIHHPMPEGFMTPLEEVDKVDPTPPDMMDTTGVGEMMKDAIWNKHKIPMKRGQPTKVFNTDHLPSIQEE